MFITRLLRKIGYLYLLLLLVAGCDSGSPEKDLVILDGSFTDNDAWRNAGNDPLLRKTSERYLHFERTPYILNFQVNCDTSAAENLTNVELMLHPDSVDVVQ